MESMRDRRQRVKKILAEWQLDCLRWLGNLWYVFETVSFEHSATNRGAARAVPAKGPSSPYATRLTSETVWNRGCRRT